MLELAELPEEQREIVLYFMRENYTSEGVSLDILSDRFSMLPNLPALLETLIASGWLTAFGTTPNIRYKILFGRKQDHRSKGLLSSLFDTSED
jgi:hypothetical protein